MSSAGKQLAARIAGTTIEDTKSAWRDAKRGLLDYLAASGAGARTETAARLLELLREEGGSAQAPYLFSDGLWGTRAQTALYHGFLGHLLDYDDVHEEIRGHPSTVILPALIALDGGRRNFERLFAAYVIGVDVMARLGKCIPGHYVAGWHSTATFGAVAAAGAGAWYCGFSETDTERVLGIAATKAAGLRLQFGSDMKAFHAGFAARTGVEAVQLVQWGFTSRDGVLDGEHGFLPLYGGGEASPGELTRDWGRPWRISEPGLWMKRYPFCSAAAHAADAAAEVYERNPAAPEQVAGIEIVYPPNGDAALIHVKPQNGEEGRFSPEYVTALILQGIKLDFAHFSEACPIDEPTKKLMEKTVRVHDPAIKPSPDAMPKGRFTILKVSYKDGSAVTARVDVPQGSPAKPLTDAEIFDKLAESIGRERANEIFFRISGL